MRTKQKPTAAAGGVGSQSARQPRSSRGEDDLARLWQRRDAAQPTQCERERKHQAARKEREAQTQAQLRRKPTTTPTPTPTPTPASARPSTSLPAAAPRIASQRDRARQQQQRQHQSKPSASAAPAAAAVPVSASSDSFDEAAQLKLQLEHLTQLSELDFEREFRKWLSQEGVEGKIQEHLRMDLMQSFHKTALGQLLRKASKPATTSPPTAPTAQQSNRLLLSPMTLALHTLVAEFLYVQNCHYTLSVFCSETPHHHTLPDFERRKEFRFSSDELQQVLQAILGEQQQQQQPALVAQNVLRLYAEQRDSLLLDFFKALVELATMDTVAMSPPKPALAGTQATQTTATVCLEIRADLDTSRLFQAEETPVAGEEHTIYMGPRISQSLYGVEQQLGQLMRHMRDLSRSCAPPVEIISQPAFEQLLQQELSERQRLETPLPPGQMVIKLPEQYLPQHSPLQPAKLEGKTTISSSGPIQLPTESSTVPKLPHLHAEQVASLAMVQQVLQQYQQQQTSNAGMQATLERVELFVGELAGCIQTLSNVLNLAMEQEYAVGRHKGFKLGYREGFAHGHFMGMQEGIQSGEQRQQQQEQQPQPPQVQLKSTSSQTQMEQPQQVQLKSTSSQTQMEQRQQVQLQSTSSQTQVEEPPPPPPAKLRSVISQTQMTRPRHRSTSTDPLPLLVRNAGCQTTETAPHPARSYEQWIYEMLHSRSGQIFLERVELSLNKALELQKQRLDELYDIKLRHHAELLRLSRRQKSWRALCRHVERDSHSLEARELVHKIFRLLEHYETHHRLLAEKIQQTEQAAEQAARIQPVWTDESNVETPDPCPLTPVSITSSTSIASRRATFAPSAGSAFVAAPPMTRPFARPVPATFAPPSATAAATPAAAASLPAFVVPVQVPAPDAAMEPAARPHMHNVATNTQSKHSLEPRVKPTVQPVPSFNEALLCAKSRMLQLEQESNLLEQSFLSYLERARAQKQRHNMRINYARERQQFHRTMDNFCDWKHSIPHDDVEQPPPPPASTAAAAAAGTSQFHDADLELELELQLGIEPDSYKFTNAIAEARHKLLSELHAPATTHSARPTLPQPAQSQSLPLMTTTTTTTAMAPSKLVELDQVQSETQLLLHRVEATLARVSKPPSLQLQLELDPPSGATQTSMEMIGDGVASRKLQRSMAKMQQLFGHNAEEEQPAKPSTVLRPWSAPTSKLQASFLPSARPHTAPSSLTDIVSPPLAAAAGRVRAGPPNLLGLLDGLSDGSDTTANSSSLTSLDNRPMPGIGASVGVGEVYTKLLANAGPTPSPSGTGSTSPSVSASLEFWKRMNL